MAFDLLARLRVKDEASATLKRATRAASGLSREMRTTSRSVSSVGRSTSVMTRQAREGSAALTHMGRSGRSAFSGMSKSAGGIVRAVTGIAAAYGAARLAVKTFQATIGAAAKMEMSKVTTTAMFNGDTKAADKYFDFIEKRAVKSMFSINEFFSTSRAFVAITKNQKELEGLTNLAERLAAMDPVQGLEGAAFALRELSSGDAVSLSERFELPKKALNTIKKLPIKEQIKEMDKLLNKMGITNKLIDDQGSTALGQYSQAADKVRFSLQKMGLGALNILKPKLVELNRFLDSSTFKKWGEIGTRALSSLTSSVTKGVDAAIAYINKHYVNNPEFSKLTTLSAKVDFVISDLWAQFKSWLDTKGKAAITSATSSLLIAFADGIKNNAPELANAALTLGKTVGGAIVKGISNAISSDPIAAAILGGTAGAAVGGAVAGPAGAVIGATVGATGGVSAHYSEKAIESAKSSSITTGLNDFYGDLGKLVREKLLDPIGLGYENRPLHGHSGGIDRVPYNDYPAMLHEGESVLPRGEAKQHRNGSRGGVTITGNTFNVRQESDIRDVALELFRMINEADNAMGGAP